MSDSPIIDAGVRLMATRRNRIKEALVEAADRVRRPIDGLSEDQRLQIAGACLALSDVVPDRIPVDIEDETERMAAAEIQASGRLILGSLYCVELTDVGSDDAAENLVEYIKTMANFGLLLAMPTQEDAA